jgi:hypothetical protein
VTLWPEANYLHSDESPMTMWDWMAHRTKQEWLHLTKLVYTSRNSANLVSTCLFMFLDYTIQHLYTNNSFKYLSMPQTSKSDMCSPCQWNSANLVGNGKGYYSPFSHLSSSNAPSKDYVIRVPCSNIRFLPGDFGQSDFSSSSPSFLILIVGIN